MGQELSAQLNISILTCVRRISRQRPPTMLLHNLPLGYQQGPGWHIFRCTNTVLNHCTEQVLVILLFRVECHVIFAILNSITNALSRLLCSSELTCRGNRALRPGTVPYKSFISCTSWTDDSFTWQLIIAP
jgi:hypothetical protein